jgi:hypothetical protein
MEPLYTARYVQTREMYMDINQYNMFVRRRWSAIRIWVMGVLLIVAGLVLLFLGGNRIYSWLVIFMGVLYLFLPWINYHWACSKQMKSDKLYLGTETLTEFFNDKVIGHSEYSQSAFPYDKLYEFRENEKYLFLYVSRNSILTIPRAAIADGRHAELTAFLRGKMPSGRTH